MKARQVKEFEPPQSSWVAQMYTIRYGRKGNRRGSIRWKFHPRHRSCVDSEAYRTEDDAIKAAFAAGYGAVKRFDGKVIKKS